MSEMHQIEMGAIRRSAVGGRRYKVQKQQVAFRRAVTSQIFEEEKRNEDAATVHPIIHPAELRRVMVY